MHFKLFLCFLVVFVLNNYSLCDTHTQGSYRGGDIAAYDKAIFTKVTAKPTNYTVIFKYIAPEFTPEITLVTIRTASHSNGTIEIKSEPGKERTVLATINIINGLDVALFATIYKASVATGLNLNALNSIHKPKIFTIAYAHNTTQTRDRKINLGQRQDGDDLLDYQTKNVTVKSRFAEDEFIFNRANNHITSIAFSFSSPTAVAFVNSTFIKENSLDVIVYDLNSPGFIANMSVYGYKSAQPYSYKSVVQTKPSVNY